MCYPDSSSRSAVLSALFVTLLGSARPELTAAEPVQFSELSPEQSGLNFIQRIKVEDSLAYLYNSGYACGGVAVGDVNGDGRPDLFMVSGPEDNALFLNQGGLKFVRAGAGAAALADSWTWGTGTAMADVDGDADLDIFVCNYDAPNRLWLNDGKGNFTDASAESGLDYAGPSHTPYFYDLDNDGDLDLYLMTNRLFYPKGRPAGAASEAGPDGKPRVKAEFAAYFRIVQPPDNYVEEGAPPGRKPQPFLLEYGHPDKLYRNEGPGSGGVPKFKDVTRGSGIENAPGHGLSVLVWDVNGDRLPDIYVANDYTDPDCLWINTGADENGFHFRNEVADYLPQTAFSSMGSDIGDFNGDGRLDFAVADMAGTTHFRAKTTMGEMTGYRRWILENDWPRQAMRNMLYLDSGAGPFQEVAFLAGVARSDWTWALKFGDFDLDGHTDMFMTTGAARNFGDSDILVDPRKMVGRTEWEFYRDTAEGRQENLAFRNGGALNFSNVSTAWGLDKNSMSYGAATGDLDGDGDLEIVTTNLTDPVSLYENKAAGAHWLTVKLEGVKNRYGIGAVVTATLEDGRKMVRVMAPQTGFISSSEPVAHFGLGKAERVTGLTVQWPGTTGLHAAGPQKANQTVTVREADAAKHQAKPAPPAPAPLFTKLDGAKSGLDFRHTEKPYDDYKKEFLLPGKLSQFGPGVAVADVNGDGLDDLYCGGAAGQTGVLFVQQNDHSFRAQENPPWAAHADTEDMGALFFDADRDGDLDLYVASGSNEWEAGDPRYADHLYLNTTPSGGAVAFTESPAGALPDLRLSGSSVCGADFDRDGDVDLFVGSRAVPGQYPLTPESVLLRNDSAPGAAPKLVEVTDAVTPGLKKAGLVTGALWSDVDGDGWPDLFVACEWGPVRLFLNQQGKLTEQTEMACLAERTGWWNGVAAFDADGDGDMDYAALNVGFNTKYGHPTAEKAAVLYREDMDGNGVFDLVEAKCSPDGELPVRGRSCSSTAMPFIREKFKTYRAFASSSLSGIYTDEKLGRAVRVSATEFASGLLMNESQPGAPKFNWQPLPAEAQYSPCYGAVAGDFAGDGHICLALAQNFYSREPETGLWNGALGCLLTSDGKGSFTAVEHARSGFVLPGDGKALASTDLNGDGWPDLVATQNDGPLAAFLRTPPETRPLVVRLAGAPGNPFGFGSLVRLMVGEKILAVREISAGSGYLSQSSSFCVFASIPKTRGLSLTVRWPSGRESRHPVSSALAGPMICTEALAGK
jgi:hypothetical protein